jgi:hypothetical protein
MPASERGPIVIFSIMRDGRAVDCAGRLVHDAEGPYAINCVEVEGNVPLSQPRVQLYEISLRRGYDAQQGQYRYYHSGTVSSGPVKSRSDS